MAICLSWKPWPWYSCCSIHKTHLNSVSPDCIQWLSCDMLFRYTWIWGIYDQMDADDGWTPCHLPKLFFCVCVAAHIVSAEGTMSSGCAGHMGCVLDLLGCLGRWFVSSSLHIKARLHSCAGFPNRILNFSGMMNINNFTCQCFIAVADLCLQNDIWMNRIHQWVFFNHFLFFNHQFETRCTMYKSSSLLQCSPQQLY